MWACNPNDIQACLNCQYKDCIVSEYKFDKYYKYNHSEKGKINQIRYELRKKQKQREDIKLQLKNYLINYKEQYDKVPTIKAVSQDFKKSMTYMYKLMLEIQEEGWI